MYIHLYFDLDLLPFWLDGGIWWGHGRRSESGWLGGDRDGIPLEQGGTEGDWMGNYGRGELVSVFVRRYLRTGGSLLEIDVLFLRASAVSKVGSLNVACDRGPVICGNPDCLLFDLAKIPLTAAVQQARSLVQLEIFMGKFVIAGRVVAEDGPRRALDRSESWCGETEGEISAEVSWRVPLLVSAEDGGPMICDPAFRCRVESGNAGLLQ
jgi:hypothetical protein